MTFGRRAARRCQRGAASDTAQRPLDQCDCFDRLRPPEPQLVAQALPRPVINYLIQVLDERAMPATNSRELPTGVSAGVLGVVLGDELLAGSGGDRAGWWHGHGPSRRSAA